MINQKNIQLFYDIVDQCITILQNKAKQNYFDALILSCNSILDSDIDLPIEQDDKIEINRLIQTIQDISFQKEEIRKSLQLLILRGFKQSNQSNQDITPDTIGIFVSFLIGKLYDKDRWNVIFDPLVGTGNLITTIGNQFNQLLTLVGVDHKEQNYKLARMMFEMMSYEDEVYFQDTFTFNNLSADVIVTDFPNSELQDELYFPYEVIKHHSSNLREDGYFISVIQNDFFDIAGANTFREVILNDYRIIGLIQLPLSMFKGMGKSILILQKGKAKNTSQENFLLAEIPSFDDEEGVKIAINRINKWIEERK